MSTTYRIVDPKPRDRSWTFKPLSKTQREVIGRMASDAWSAQVTRGILTVPEGTTKTAAAKAWRHAQYAEVTGRDTLDTCDQSHFRSLCAHFRAIIGTPAAAARSFRDAMRTGPVSDNAAPEDTFEAREMWRAKLRQACAEFGFSMGYPTSICRVKFKAPIEAASADQLRMLTFDIRRNGQARRRKHRAAAAEAAPENQPF